jgi:hypothetical protein
VRASELLQREIEASAGEFVLPVKHFSATSLKMGMTCAEQYRQRYILGRKERPGAALIQGSADHAAHELNFQQKIKSGTDLPVGEVVNEFHAAWERELEERDDVQWGSDKPDQIRAHGAKMVELYRTEIAPRVQPLAVEWEFSTQLEHTPVPLIGKVDVIHGDPDRIGAAVGVPIAEKAIERKTSKRTEKKPKTAWRFQRKVYQVAMAAELKQALPMEFHVVTKLKTPTVLSPLTPDTDLFFPFSGVEAENTRRLVEMTAWRLNQMYLTFGPDEPWEGVGTVHDWACDFCGFQKDCVWVQR